MHIKLSGSAGKGSSAPSFPGRARRTALSLAVVAALVLSSTLASAQGNSAPAKDYVEKKVDGGTVVTFPGDELPGDPNDPYGGVIHRPPRVLKANLIQPRLNFIPELLKSVEHL